MCARPVDPVAWPNLLECAAVYTSPSRLRAGGSRPAAARRGTRRVRAGAVGAFATIRRDRDPVTGVPIYELTGTVGQRARTPRGGRRAPRARAPSVDAGRRRLD